MRATPVIRGRTIPVRVRNNFNGGMPFLVKITPQAKYSFLQTRQLLETVCARLKGAPYYRLIKGKTVKVCVAAQDEFDALGFYYERANAAEHTAPELASGRNYYLAMFRPQDTTVYLNSEDLAGMPAGLMPETVTHEFLHAYSCAIISAEPRRLEIVNGIWHLSERSRILTRGKYLNEGLTEYLRIRGGGAESQGCYAVLCRAIEILAGRIGDEILYEAYFNGRIGQLEAAIDNIHGPGAFEELSCLANEVGGEEARQLDYDNLIGFAQQGSEYWLMQRWGYSAEDRTRAPRRISADEVPADSLIGQGFCGVEGGVRIYTNLTGEELAAFFRQLPKAEKHDRISPTELPFFPRAVRWWVERGALLCLIFARLEGKPLVEISTFLIDPKYLDYPHFLGRPAESFAVLSNVELD